jgi:hypothetical protein
MPVNDEEYQKEYDKAAAELEAAAQATTARGADGKFTKAEPAPAEPEPVTTPEAGPATTEEPDPLAELRARLEKTEKIAKDNQAWATRMAQEAAQLRKEREEQQRAASKPAILDANPELADAIRYVAQDPASQNQEAARQQEWQTAIEKAHPELETAIAERFKAIGADVQDPLVAIREITAEKLAYTERQVGKRFAAEAAKQAKVSAMTVPGAGAGGGARTAPDAALAEVERINKMSDAEFAKEVKRVKGY